MIGDKRIIVFSVLERNNWNDPIGIHEEEIEFIQTEEDAFKESVKILNLRLKENEASIYWHWWKDPIMIERQKELGIE